MSFSINGLASGLDTAQIITDMMKLERVPFTNLETKKSNMQTEQGVFRAINTKLKALETALADLKLASSFEKNKAVFSNTNIGSATVGGQAQPGSYSITVHNLALKQIEGVQNLSGSAGSLTDSVFKINGQDIVIGGTGSVGTFANNKEALEALVKEINGDTTKYGGKASLISTGTDQYALSVTADKDANITFSFSTKDVTPATINASTTLQAGTSASFTINGVTVSSASNEIEVTDGVTLQLQSVGASTLTIGRDVESITKKIETFVSAYNDLIGVVKDNIAKPADKDIINPLQGDSTLKALQSMLYTTFTQIVNKADNTFVGFMEQIGLSIDKGVKSGSLMTGKISFDKSAFEQMLATSPDKVTELFLNRMENLSTKIGEYTGSTHGILSVKVTGYDTEIKMVDERLANMERKLELKELRLKTQFNNMEVMMSSLKNQQNWLSSQFESLLNSSKK